MKRKIVFLLVILGSALPTQSFAQKQDAPPAKVYLYDGRSFEGEIVLIRAETVQFRVSGERMIREFTKSEIRVLVPSEGDPITFDVPSPTAAPSPAVSQPTPDPVADGFFADPNEERREARERAQRQEDRVGMFTMIWGLLGVVAVLYYFGG